MANFNKYSEITEAAAKPDKIENQSNDVKEMRKAIEKLTKEVKKERRRNKKMIKYLCRKTAEEKNVEKETAVCEEDSLNKKNNTVKKVGRKIQKFLGKVGDALVKALPSMLRTATRVAGELILGRMSLKAVNLGRAIA